MTARFASTRRVLAATALASFMLGLSACSSINSVRDVPEYFNSDIDGTPPREFVTEKDVKKLKVGMTPLAVKNLLGPPLSPEKTVESRFDSFSFFNIFSKNDYKEPFTSRYDYLLRDTSSGKAEFVPYAVDFQKTKTLGLVPTVGVKSFGPLEKPVLASFAAPPSMAAPAADATPVESAPVVATDVPAPAPAAEPASPTDDIIKAVQSWAQAWASKDADAYIGFYTPAFDNGMGGRSKWEGQRRKRLSNPNTITLSLSDIKITPKSDTAAEVSFRQEYQSNLFKENGQKTLVMTRADGQWKIEKEIFKKK
ncbi:MAG: nuclear transport factor 2 family protein [Burkholderiales bacterium]|nr:nuclear transport factor 2 family protein [Burkholderiales bacterium]